MPQGKKKGGQAAPAPAAEPKTEEAPKGKKGGKKAEEAHKKEEKPQPAPEPKKEDPKEQEDGQVEEEDDDDDEEEESEDMPDLEPATQGGAQAKTGNQKTSRSEKKSRKALAKVGLKPVPGIVRVTVKKSKNMLFVIQSPEIFKSPVSDTYVVFGEAKIEDLTQAAQEGLADAITGKAAAAAAEKTSEAKPAAGGTVEEIGDDEEVDETGVEAKDIELVMQQANVSRARAVKALKKNDMDIVNAIMDLTM
jgi:nascent polypeptide-associated complex subunit alpha